MAHEDSAVGAHRERGADLGRRLLAPDRGHDDLAAVLLLQPQRFLDGDLVEGVHLVVHPFGHDPGAVRLHLIFDSGSSTRFAVTRILRGMGT